MTERTIDEWVDLYEQAISPDEDCKDQVRKALQEFLTQHGTEKISQANQAMKR
jgi:hypothetical protein